MEIIVIHSGNDLPPKSADFLRFALSQHSLCAITLQAIARGANFSKPADAQISLPNHWNVMLSETCQAEKRSCRDTIKCPTDVIEANDPLLILSNGRFVTTLDTAFMNEIIDFLKADVIAVIVDPSLAAYRENVRLTSDNRIAGFRRLHHDGARVLSIPGNWPHHLVIRNAALPALLANQHIPLSFATLAHRCKTHGITFAAVAVGGALLDLDQPDDLVSFVMNALGRRDNERGKTACAAKYLNLRGPVVLGKNVNIAPDALVIGPAIINDNVLIQPGAIVKNAIIASDVSVGRDDVITDCILTHDSNQYRKLDFSSAAFCRNHTESVFTSRQKSTVVFRNFPLISYARLGKRIADILGAIMILTLFLPVFPVIGILIKLASPGPVFYKSHRQGRHGKTIKCLKFRSMVQSADDMQEKLRVINEVDGPQFKMLNDPRVNSIGRFLRDTSIDEIPQFLNVLFGQMSIVGPRPSPESENSQCPYWRDARLSVKPGITGLWQVSRTRSQHHDFQEWVHYDTNYVKNISMKMDLCICLKTAKKLINDLLDQF